jgi:hypothetical protein
MRSEVAISPSIHAPFRHTGVDHASALKDPVHTPFIHTFIHTCASEDSLFCRMRSEVAITRGKKKERGIARPLSGLRQLSDRKVLGDGID